MRRMILESPYAGSSRVFGWYQRWLNRRYARRCVRDSLSRGEAPIASHLLYTQPGILCDEDSVERQWGIDAGLSWGDVADASVVYIDRGVSRGMRYGVAAAKAAGRLVEYRSLINRCPAPSSSVIATRISVRTSRLNSNFAHNITRSMHAGTSE